MATTTSAGPTALLDRSSSNPKSSYIQWTKPCRQDSRIELVKRLETDEVSIVDFQSTDRAQVEGVTRDQLHVHAVGYEELTQTSAGLIEVLDPDEEGKNPREEVREQLLIDVRDRIRTAGMPCGRTCWNVSAGVRPARPATCVRSVAWRPDRREDLHLSD